MKKSCFCIFLIIFLPNHGLTQTYISRPSEFINDSYHDISPPLRKMKMLSPDSQKVRWENNEVPNNSFLFDWKDQNQSLGRSIEIDPLIQDKMGMQDPISSIANFEGIAVGKGNLFPPDPNGAAGLNYYIQTVNTAFAIYSKTGDSVYGPASLGTLWQGFPGYHGSDGDPIVLFDHLANRWFVSQFSLPNYPNGPFYELIAISKTEDPLGSWNRYSFQFKDMPDYPKFGIWPDGYYMSTNTFSSGVTNWIGPAATVVERDSMLIGAPARMVMFQLASSMPHMLPASLDGPAPPVDTPAYFMAAKDNSGSSNDQLKIYELHVDWDSTAKSVFSGPLILSIAGYSSKCQGEGCIPQKDVTQKLDAEGKRLMNRLQYRNFGGYQSMVLNHTIGATEKGQAGIRWYEIRKTNTDWAVFQQSTYAPDTLDRWNASIAMDRSGDIALGYSISGKAIFPSIGISGRRADDAPNQMSCMEEIALSGTGSQSGTDRWGDYSSLNLDPTDDNTFWYTNMYYKTTNKWSWNTRITSFKISDLHVNVDKAVNVDYISHLRKNFPNPFSQTTTLHWGLTQPGMVKVQIIDPTGRIIAILNNTLQEPGEYFKVFDASSLKAGIYFCQLLVGKTTESQKLILIK